MKENLHFKKSNLQKARKALKGAGCSLRENPKPAWAVALRAVVLRIILKIRNTQYIVVAVVSLHNNPWSGGVDRTPPRPLTPSNAEKYKKAFPRTPATSRAIRDSVLRGQIREIEGGDIGEGVGVENRNERGDFEVQKSRKK